MISRHLKAFFQSNFSDIFKYLFTSILMHCLIVLCFFCFLSLFNTWFPGILGLFQFYKLRHKLNFIFFCFSVWNAYLPRWRGRLWRKHRCNSNNLFLQLFVSHKFQLNLVWVYNSSDESKAFLRFMRRTVDSCIWIVELSTALLTFLITKHINSCNNAFLKQYFLGTTYGVFRSLIFNFSGTLRIQFGRWRWNSLISNLQDLHR